MHAVAMMAINLTERKLEFVGVPDLDVDVVILVHIPNDILDVEPRVDQFIGFNSIRNKTNHASPLTVSMPLGDRIKYSSFCR